MQVTLCTGENSLNCFMAKDGHGSGGGWRTESLLQSAIMCLIPCECVDWVYSGKLLKRVKVSGVTLPYVSLAVPIYGSYIGYLEILVLKFSSWENQTSQTIISWPPSVIPYLFLLPCLHLRIK